MAALEIDGRLLDKLAAQAIMRGHTMSDEIVRRIELSFDKERPDPIEWR